MIGFLTRFFGDPHKKTLSRYELVLRDINREEENVKALSDEEIRKRSLVLKERGEAGEDLGELLPEAFALVREASRRTLGQRHFDVQLLGGIALEEGKIAQMLTGEGKTLAATAPAYLNALSGKGVHVVTVNDYLARRDAVWMGQIYHFLGLSVGCLTHDQAYIYDPEYRHVEEKSALDSERDITGSFKVFEDFLRPVSRREAYGADLTYGTNHEFGFDYLRDNLVYRASDLVQRQQHYVIVDEVDSILIDEARTPLIISVPDQDAAKLYREFTRLVPRLRENDDYNVDPKMRAVTLTDQGIEKIEKLLSRKIYEEGNLVFIHHLEEALKAHVLFKRDKDYVVKGGEIILVDEFTGRLMPGRRYTGGLHQALEAKEGVPIKEESRILATITLQNYFRLYGKLAGMTGTAAPSAEEFHKVYGLDVVMVPPNKPMIRQDLPDSIYQTEKGKFQALLREIKLRHEKGQPLLIGTISISKNEYLSKLLSREGIPHELLNAKNHEREGAIIAQAGKKGAVTVATNMAGRGVDIILGGNPPDPMER
ncbi:MAG: preprotein translocase subunit SecA, partial [Parcubacteria group bacterium]|nr:preprotein translocase subunit SecA [Parcubacteria group bacterium]